MLNESAQSQHSLHIQAKSIILAIYFASFVGLPDPPYSAIRENPEHIYTDITSIDGKLKPESNGTIESQTSMDSGVFMEVVDEKPN